MSEDYENRKEAGQDCWTVLARPFDASEIRHYQGRGGQQMSYVDRSAVMARLDEALTPAGWSFNWELTEHTDSRSVVKGRLVVHLGDQDAVREDVGYSNSDNPEKPDPEPIKSAVSDALKRCADGFGVGRHLRHKTSPAGATAPRGPQNEVERVRREYHDMRASVVALKIDMPAFDQPPGATLGQMKMIIDAMRRAVAAKDAETQVKEPETAVA